MSTNRIQIGQLLTLQPPPTGKSPPQNSPTSDSLTAKKKLQDHEAAFPASPTFPASPAFPAGQSSGTTAGRTLGSTVGLPTGDCPRLFLPLHYEPNYKYPLIVWLHSGGDDSAQLLRVMPGISLRNYVGVAPAGNLGNPAQGNQWSQSPSGISAAVERVSQAIDHAQIKTSIRPDRVFLAGYGNGGTMALRVGFELSHLVAGVLSFNGPFPQGMTPLRDWMSCRKVPLFWSHGRKSEEFCEGKLCDQLKLLHIAGFNVTLRQYPHGDELPATALSDANRWIMESISSAIV